MAGVRDTPTAGTPTSFATDLYGVPATNQNSCQMLTGLYKKLEPQLCKSYRRHVVYIPSQTPEVKITASDKKKNKLRAVNMALDAVNEFQRKKDNSKGRTVGAKIDFKEATKKALDLAKSGSKSMPNLNEATTDS